MILFGIQLWWDEERDQCSFNALTAVLWNKKELKKLQYFILWKWKGWKNKGWGVGVSLNLVFVVFVSLILF